ncbi:hypothetical protein M885DRAFT_528149 [Pelagophyceae sp. CCMP2097]|nr:hypothetical protein M885DRAFT_528149 [Pelagophyceae sp. CCMP2097]
MPTLSSSLVFSSLALLVHAGWSTTQFKALAGAGASVPPPDVVIEVCLAFLLALAGAVMQMPVLKQVRSMAESTPELMDSFLHSADFMTMQHRGKSLSQRRRTRDGKAAGTPLD